LDRALTGFVNLEILRYFLTDASFRKLQELNLPAALEMLDRPVELPVALLQHASEVRAEDGPNRIRRLIGDVESLCNQDRGLLNEVSEELISHNYLLIELGI
jgi:programmed cell death 6-interacting protein